jgi:hypothetical protein
MDCEIKNLLMVFYHPESEEQIICLVKKLMKKDYKFSTRSYAFNCHAIYTDPGRDKSTFRIKFLSKNHLKVQTLI